jgi:hypothetical protein
MAIVSFHPENSPVSTASALNCRVEKVVIHFEAEKSFAEYFLPRPASALPHSLARPTSALAVQGSTNYT